MGRTVPRFDALHDAGLTVLLLAYPPEITRFTPPDSEPYDRYDMALHKRARAMVHEWPTSDSRTKRYTISKTVGKGANAKRPRARQESVGVVCRRFSSSPATHEVKTDSGLAVRNRAATRREYGDELLGRIAHSFLSRTDA